MSTLKSNFSPFFTDGKPGGSLILDRNLLAIQKAINAVDLTVNRITRIIDIDIGGASINDAPYWLSAATAGLPNAVDMGALGTGVLQQVVTAGISAPEALPLALGQVLYGGADTLIAQSANLYFDASNVRLGVGTGTPDALALATFLRNQDAETNLFISNSSAGTNAAAAILVQAASSDVFATGPYIVMGTYGRNLVPPVPWPYFAGGSTVISTYTDEGLTFDLSEINPFSAPTWRWVTHDVGPAYTQLLRMELDYAGHLAIADLIGGGSDHLVYAVDASGRLALVTLGAGLSFIGGTLAATGGTGTVTSVSGTAGRISSTGGTTPIIDLINTAVTPGSYTYASLTVDAAGRLTAASSGATPQPAGNYITALTGDGTATGPGSVPFTLATVNANVGSFTYASITVNAKGLITAASSGATPQPAGNYITALTGDGTATGPGSVPLTLATVNSNVGSFTYGSFTVNAKGLITAASSGATPQAPITWPAVTQVLYSSGTSTDPIGASAFTYETARLALRNNGPLSLNIDADSVSASYLVTVASTASRDRAWWQLGGVTVSSGTNVELFTIAPASMVIDTANISLLAALRVRGRDYTLTGVSAGTVASIYADQPTFNGGNIADPSTSCWVYYGGGGTTSVSKLEGSLLMYAGAASSSLSVGVGFHVLDTTGIKFFNVGVAIGVAQQTITGSRGGNAALASLITAGAAYGLWVDGTTP